MNTKITLKNIIITGISAALIFAVTYLIKIPVPSVTGAYINLGDTVIYVFAFLLNPVFAMLAAGIGSFLADLLGGYGQYMFATLIIKGLMGYFASIIMRNGKFSKYTIGCIVGGIIMICGYFAFEYFVFGWAATIPNIPYNLIQFAGGVVIAILLYAVVVRLKKQLLK